MTTNAKTATISEKLHAEWRRRDALHAVENEEILRADINSGEAFRAATITGQFGASLSWARRLREDEKSQYREWFRDRCMVGYAGGPNIDVEARAIREVVKERRSDGEFSGTSNDAWVISEDEWNAILCANEKVRAADATRAAEFRVEEEAEHRRRVESGYCYHCESWCYGDCGH